MLFNGCVISLIFKWTLHGPHSMICAFLLWTTISIKLPFHLQFGTCVGFISF
ncbi:uncharacterized protein DS421_19g641280 [Arachis hypogaea]|uniref:Uncharacterized protein n=1 Tax=Arachis hypogaea TaxID=3818 RepID=A0A6B9V4A5_ARAHY|nr:uncharacterized protein DS421_19g641280 [Arachis hypogaea]